MKTRLEFLSRNTDGPNKQGESHKRLKLFWLSVALVGVGLLLVGVSVSLAEIQSLLSGPPASFGVEQAQAPLATEPAILPRATQLPSTGGDPQATDDDISGIGIGEEPAASATPKATETDSQEMEEPTEVVGEEASTLTPEAEALPSDSLPTEAMTEEAPTAALPETSMPEPTATPLPPETPTPLPPTETPVLGPPTRIVAPSIGLDTKVVEVGWSLQEQDGSVYKVWAVADYAAGWHNETKKPGEVGNMVITGHNNMRGEVFRNVVDLGPGDEILVYVGDQVYTYAVESRLLLQEKGATDEARADNARWIGEFPDERLTLITCWPYTGNSHRVIVIAKPSQVWHGQ